MQPVALLWPTRQELARVVALYSQHSHTTQNHDQDGRKPLPTKAKVTNPGSDASEDPLLRIGTLLNRVEERAERAEKRVEALEEFIRNELFLHIASPPEAACSNAAPLKIWGGHVWESIQKETGAIDCSFERRMSIRAHSAVATDELGCAACKGKGAHKATDPGCPASVLFVNGGGGQWPGSDSYAAAPISWTFTVTTDSWALKSPPVAIWFRKLQRPGVGSGLLLARELVTRNQNASAVRSQLSPRHVMGKVISDSPLLPLPTLKPR
ncbi:hypothetical protein EDB80DRAFT_808538 [Ilyonectria destructans]|nr:hypothetical protein EDB80DRAFT_808538 [Ilyonectria destructans]